MSFKVDTLVINESKLDSAVHNNYVYLIGFELVREDPKVKGRNGGGACSLQFRFVRKY